MKEDQLSTPRSEPSDLQFDTAARELDIPVAELKEAFQAMRARSEIETHPGCSRCGAKTAAQCNDKGCHFLESGVEPSSAIETPSFPTWYCGCGHTNGCNLAFCAACNRTPAGRHKDE